MRGGVNDFCFPQYEGGQRKCFSRWSRCIFIVPSPNIMKLSLLQLSNNSQACHSHQMQLIFCKPSLQFVDYFHLTVLISRCEVQNGVGELSKTIYLDVQGKTNIPRYVSRVRKRGNSSVQHKRQNYLSICLEMSYWKNYYPIL